jgi:hypothetical protein
MCTTRVVPFAFLVLGSVALAKVEANTDGLVWDKDYPKSTEVFVGLGKYMISAAGGLDKANYPNIKIDGDLAFMEVVQVDKNGKDVDGTKKAFKGNADKDKGTWSVNTLKEWKNGMEVNFDGFPAGKYRVKVQVKVKEDANAQQRDAYIEIVSDIPTMQGKECDTEQQAIRRSRSPVHRRITHRNRLEPRHR